MIEPKPTWASTVTRRLGLLEKDIHEIGRGVAGVSRPMRAGAGLQIVSMRIESFPPSALSCHSITGNVCPTHQTRSSLSCLEHHGGGRMP